MIASAEQGMSLNGTAFDMPQDLMEQANAGTGTFFDHFDRLVTNHPELETIDTALDTKEFMGAGVKALQGVRDVEVSKIFGATFDVTRNISGEYLFDRLRNLESADPMNPEENPEFQDSEAQQMKDEEREQLQESLKDSLAPRPSF